jgi:hypothetical protein
MNEGSSTPEPIAKDRGRRARIEVSAYFTRYRAKLMQLLGDTERYFNHVMELHARETREPFAFQLR